MQGREILVAVTGGIAAYKAATLVSRLVQQGNGVTV
ncbi:MAG: phosphopantothenoylcysteine decarboxylase, partial [Planctomycetota bacterium]|nr:phosphopantothenoylcysteine decarboxylase [Planctomycetota bacterium]